MPRHTDLHFWHNRIKHYLGLRWRCNDYADWRGCNEFSINIVAFGSCVCL